MRILVANKFWYRRAGQERVVLDEVAWLEGAGHTVAHFSAAHPDNDPSPWSDYFVPYLELGPGRDLSPVEKVRAVARMFYSLEARRRFVRLFEDFRPDVVHVHGIHRQISPSILDVARARGIPVVQTLHDCHHVCPEYQLGRGGRERCEPRACGELWYGPCVRYRCIRDSLTLSALSAAETSFQRVRRVYERGIARFICPSRCLAELMAQGGWTVPTDIVPNAVPLPESRGARVGDGFAIVGRLARDKGIGVAIEAARRAGAPVTVAGDGPMGAKLRAAYPEVDFVGYLSADEVDELVSRSRALLMPSLWFENAPMSILEAMAAGKPVIGSALGGIPEQVTDGVDGLLVPPGDVDALAAAMRTLSEDDDLVARMGAAARETVGRRFCPERHVEALLVTYEAAGERG